MSGRHYLTDCVLWETITFWHKHYFPCVSCFISAVFKLYFLTSHSCNASCSQILSCQSRLYNVWPTLAVEHRRERFSIIPRPDVSLRLPSINVCSEYLCYLYTFFLYFLWFFALILVYYMGLQETDCVPFSYDVKTTVFVVSRCTQYRTQNLFDLSCQHSA